MAHRLTVHLMGGLGNQMFQYAAARALALRNAAQLRLDTRGGFARDKVYKRLYELGDFPIQAASARWLEAAPFMIEAARQKVVGATTSSIGRRFYGSAIRETHSRFLSEVATHRMTSNAWMWGYWQTEQYFSDVAGIISKELTPPAPTHPQFLQCADLMASSNSVAVGVRLFEEVPGVSKGGVGGLTHMPFFNEAARLLATRVQNPTFFVFCTTNSPQLQQLDLPGPVHLITHENGYEGSIAPLWLISQARHHIIANSSFYWWGAWLREAQHPETQIIASPLFPNRDSVPSRWTVLGNRGANELF